MWDWSLSQEDPLEEGMATHSNILAWRIPWTEEPGGLQPVSSQRVGHHWNDLARRHSRVRALRGVPLLEFLYQFLEIYSFICFWLCWIFAAVCRILSSGLWVSHCDGFSCCWAPALGCAGFSSCGMWARSWGSRAPERRLDSCSTQA